MAVAAFAVRIDVFKGYFSALKILFKMMKTYNWAF